MKNEKIFSNNLDLRVDSIIRESMDIYINRLVNGLLEVGLEATFQLNLARILKDLLNIKIVSLNERFQVLLEKNIPINGNKDYIDIVIKYTNNNKESIYLIELKNKKISDSVPDLGNVVSYIDMYNLDCHMQNLSSVIGCFFIFLTDLKTYKNKPRIGTRKELPMHDKSEIKASQKYDVTGKAAIKAMGNYHKNGFKFSTNHLIKYTNFKIQKKDYWFFIEKM